MNKMIDVDEKLLQEAKQASGATSDTETVRLGLEAVVRSAAYQRLMEFRGSEPDAVDVPRRREDPPSERKVA